MNEVIKSLRKMHNLEKFAVEIYRTQIGAFTEKGTVDKLKTAMDNEQEHVNNLQKRITEMKEDCSWLGMFFQKAGQLLGFTTTVISKEFLFKTDIWLERRAVRDYSNFLQTLDFDEELRNLIHSTIEDEKRHIIRWEESLKILKENHSR